MNTAIVPSYLPCTPFSRTFIFLAKLAWKSRVTLPMIVTAAFMAMDFRMQDEDLNHEHPDEELSIFSDSQESWQTIDSDDEDYDEDTDEYDYEIDRF